MWTLAGRPALRNWAARGGEVPRVGPRCAPLAMPPASACVPFRAGTRAGLRICCYILPLERRNPTRTTSRSGDVVCRETHRAASTRRVGAAPVLLATPDSVALSFLAHVTPLSASVPSVIVANVGILVFHTVSTPVFLVPELSATVWFVDESACTTMSAMAMCTGHKTKSQIN